MTIQNRITHIGLILSLVSGIAFAQSQQFKKVVTINGRSGELNIYSIDGKMFVDLESLASLANGTINVRGNEIELTLPTPAIRGRDEHARESDSRNMTNNFMKAGVNFIAAIRTWTNALSFAAQKGVPGDGSRIVVLRDRAAEALKVAQVDISSGADASAYEFLSTHFNDVQKWSDRLIAERRSMDTAKYSASAEALERDPAYQRIANCTRFLGSMVPSGNFQEDPNCK